MTGIQVTWDTGYGGRNVSGVCLECTDKFFGSYPLSSGMPECNAGSSQLHYEGYNTLCRSKCVYHDNSIDDLRY